MIDWSCALARAGEGVVTSPRGAAGRRAIEGGVKILIEVRIEARKRRARG
jgi:hypothetical protein